MKRSSQVLLAVTGILGVSAAADYFGSPARDEAKQLVAQLERHARRGQPMKATTETAQDTLPIKRYQHKVWVTRPRPGVDRMASGLL